MSVRWSRVTQRFALHAASSEATTATRRQGAVGGTSASGRASRTGTARAAQNQGLPDVSPDNDPSRKRGEDEFADEAAEAFARLTRAPLFGTPPQPSLEPDWWLQS